jgi:hypothetical protein
MKSVNQETRQCLNCPVLFTVRLSPSRVDRGKFCSRSCGAAYNSNRHGHSSHSSQSPTYTSWSNMKSRCQRITATEYEAYGGRGITFPRRWQKFENFLADMGERPPNTTLDRKDNAKSYSKQNCRWATRSEQQRNRRTNILITHDGLTQCLKAWEESAGISMQVISYRLKRGWSVAQALTITPRHGNHVLRIGLKDSPAEM